MHPDDELIQRFSHSELDERALRTVRAHLQTCRDCRERQASMEQEEHEIEDLLRELDEPAPRVRAGDVASRARAGRLTWLRWAAAIVIALGVAGGAYAAPGSPLPGWIAAAREFVRGGGEDSPSSSESSSEVAAPPSPAGVAVDPGRELAIVFTSAQQSGRLRVTLTEGAEVVIRASGSAVGFSSELDRLVIDNGGSSSDFEIEIPRSAPRVEVLVEAQRVFLVEGGRVTTESAPEVDKSYVLPWGGERP